MATNTTTTPSTTTSNNTSVPTPTQTPTATSSASSTTTAQSTPTTTTPTTYTSASLYVGDIGPDVTETSLFDIFNQVGPVASIRVCRDAITRRSLGYAYVNFHNPQDANTALESLNNQPIKGKPCRIMWSQRDPSVRKSGKGNIFIKNLDKSIDHKQLFDTFNQFGPILSCKIELDEHNQSKGYGYIQYLNQEYADKATQQVNGMMLFGKQVFVGPFVSRKERLSSNSNKKFTNVYANNLSETVSDEELKEMFGKFGTIKSAVVMKDDAGKSKGFAFINFENPEDAAKCVDELNGKEINGKSLYVGRAQKKAERESELRQKFEVMKMEQMAKYQGVNLYVKNLDDDFDDSKVLQIFGQFGTITSAKIMKDSKGVSKGFGFVCYSSPDEATKAVSEMNGKIVGSKPLYVALAQRKDVRRMQLEAQFANRTKGIPTPRMPGLPTATPLYNGTPVFYPGPGGPNTGAYGQPPLVFGNPMVPRGRFPPGPGPYPNVPPNYLVVSNTGGRGGQVPMKNVNMGRGNVPSGRGRGMKQPHHSHNASNANANTQQGAVSNNTGSNNNNNQQVIESIVPQSNAGPVSMEEQKNLLGEKLYPLIHKTQPSLAGKITGMILDSSDVEEILSLIERPESLNEKVSEALKVLKDHNEKVASEQ